MLELPGMTVSGDAGEDVQRILRYLSKLVPQLEMELVNAKQDDYSSAMNALTQGVGVVDRSSTAGALAAHELRKDNPHGVTAAQLGISLDKAVKVSLNNGGLCVRIGEKRGLQINAQDVSLEVTSWTRHGGVSYVDKDLGEWNDKIPVLYYAGVTLRNSADKDIWPGNLAGSETEQMGRLRIYHECDSGEDSVPVGDAMTVRMTVIGVGVFGYGEY